jgi:hypothetical protein
LKGGSDKVFIPKPTILKMVLPFDYEQMTFDISECRDHGLLNRYSEEEVQNQLESIRNLVYEDMKKILFYKKFPFIKLSCIVAIFIGFLVLSTPMFNLNLNWVLSLIKYLIVLFLFFACAGVFFEKKIDNLENSVILKMNKQIESLNQPLQNMGIQWKLGTNYYWVEINET